MSIKYSYNRTGTERKALVEAVSRILEKPAVYLGAPTFAYAVGDYRVSKKGSLFCLNNIRQGEIERLVLRLQEQGFIAETSAEEDSPAEETAADTVEAVTGNVAGGVTETATGSTDTAPLMDTGNSDEENTLTIEMPKTGFTDTSLDNLHKIIASKEALIKKAFGAERLPVADTGDTLKFPWFTLHGLEGEAEAYSRLIAAICSMAKKQKRVTAKEHGTGNDKFDMRLFLVRLGFVGDEYKAARKILLRNLTGNSSWKSGHAPVRTAPDTGVAGSVSQPENIPAERNTETVSQPETEEGDSYGK